MLAPSSSPCRRHRARHLLERGRPGLRSHRRCAAQTKEPVRQGLVSMTGTFLDTIVVCSMTGLALVMTGAYQIPGLEGAAVTTAAFQAGLPFIPGEVVSFVLMACLVLFGFTTILAGTTTASAA